MKASIGFVLLFLMLCTISAEAIIIGMPWKDTLRVTSVGSLAEPVLEVEYDGLECPQQMTPFIPDMFGLGKNGEVVPTYILTLARLEGTKPRTKPIFAISFFPQDKNSCRNPKIKKFHFFIDLWQQLFVNEIAGAKEDFKNEVFTLDICYQFPTDDKKDSIIGCKDIKYSDLSGEKALIFQD